MEYDNDSVFIGQHTACIANEYPENKFGKKRRSCNSSDALSIYEHENIDGSLWYDATCWSCKQYFTKDEVHSSRELSSLLGVNPENGVVKDKQHFENKATKKKKITNKEVKELWDKTGGKDGQSGKDYRGHSDWVLKFYGFRIEYDRKGDVKAIYYPETVDGKLYGYKSRHLPKKFGYNNYGKTGISSDLSGQCRFPDGAKYCLLVGGEEDIASAQDMLREYQKKKGQEDYSPYAVVSPTTGEPSAAKQCRRQYEWFDKFDIIIIGMDNDEVGQEAAEEIAEVLPKEKVRIAAWSGKDPNNMHLQGNTRQFWSDFFGARELIASGITSSSSLRDKIRKALVRPRIGLPPEMFRLQEATKGDGFITNRIYNLIGDTSTGKCLAKDTPIMMFDRTIKMSQDIKLGDKIMGADGTVRNVLSTTTGRENMYKISQVDGMDYTVNESHILSLRAGYDCKASGVYKGDIVNVSVKDWFGYGNKLKRSLKGYKGKLTELGKGNSEFEPYMLGYWLADGSSDQPTITVWNEDKELHQEIHKFCERNGFEATICPSRYRETTTGYYIKGGYKTFLVENGLINNKHIPDKYLFSSWDDRVNLLSGLLDGDGYLTNNGYEIIQKSKTLSNDIVFLAKSLGFKCSIKEVTKGCQGGFEGKYFKMFISGDTPMLNLKLTRKQCDKVSKLRSNHNTAIQVTPLGEGDYYGFELDGDHLFCLEDFTVTHNTTFINTMSHFWFFLKDFKVGVVSLEASDGEYGIDILSYHLKKNLYWGDEEYILDYLDEPEIVVETNKLLTNEYGEERFVVLDDREGTIESLQSKMEQMKRQYGCNIIIVDVATDFLRTLTQEQQAMAYNWQSNFVKEGVTIFNVLHTRKQSSNRDGIPKKPDEYDALGSSIFVQKSAGNLIIYRNKLCKDDPIEQNSTYWDVPKMRQGSTGDKTMVSYYDADTKAVYDREKFFEMNPDKLPVGYDLSVSSFDKAYYQEGGRGFKGEEGSKFRKPSLSNEPEDDFDIVLSNGFKI